MLRTVAATMPFYHMLTFLMPKAWCADLDISSSTISSGDLIPVRTGILLLNLGLLYAIRKIEVDWVFGNSMI